MPPNTVRICRPTFFGNPFKVGVDGTQSECVEKFKQALFSGALRNFAFADRPYVGWKTYLRSKNLACWCKLSEPCHGDILLEIVNK